MIGGKNPDNCQDTARLKLLFLLTGDKTEVQTWTKYTIVTIVQSEHKHSIVTMVLSEHRPILLLFE